MGSLSEDSSIKSSIRLLLCTVSLILLCSASTQAFPLTKTATTTATATATKTTSSRELSTRLRLQSQLNLFSRLRERLGRSSNSSTSKLNWFYRKPTSFATDHNRGQQESSPSSFSVQGLGEEEEEPFPELSEKGIYQIKSEEQYNTLLQSNPDKLVVIKYYATYCRACKALEPQFLAVKKDKQLTNLPIVWAEFASQRKTRDLFQRLNVVALPTVQFYDGSRGLVENFPCGPAKIPLLKQKLAQFLNTRVDPQTLQLKDVVQERQIEPRVEREVIIDGEIITEEHINYLRHELPFFEDLTDEEFEELLKRARLLTFDPGDLIIRQGMPPTTFYVLKSGRVEMSIKSKFDDPLSTPKDYLGVVVNELKKFDYFGERALTTGEPYSATIRVVEKTRAFAFHVDDIPESSILSKKRRATREMVEKLSERYELPADYTPTYPVTPRDQCVLELLVRFKQIRQAAKCFEYIMKSQPKWGDQGEIARRTMLVNKLSKAQADEFQEVFSIVDKDKKGKISLLEMRKFMESARANHSTDEIMEMLARANPKFDENKDYAISRDEFMGVMAEAEFYNLFTATFEELDENKIGYVRAGDLDEILGGVRDLISNDRTNMIDVEDKDMLVDYEQFSKMLLGAAL